jgi:hypothetical protein
MVALARRKGATTKVGKYMEAEQALMWGKDALIWAESIIKQLHADLFVPMRVFEEKGKLLMCQSFLELKWGLSVMLE